MAAKEPTPTPRYCIQPSTTFTKQDGWRLLDISVHLAGNIAVSRRNVNTHQTSIEVYSVRNSNYRDKPKIFYSKQFEKYVAEGRRYWFRLVSFVDLTDDNVLLTGLGDKLEVIDLIQDRVLKSRKITLIDHGVISCLSVREREIFIGFYQSNKITVYDVIDLNEIKSIILQGIQDGYYPYDMTAIADRIFVCVSECKEGSNDRSLIFEEKNGRILSELTKPTDTVHWYAQGITVCVTLSALAVTWSQTYKGTQKGIDVIVFYSLFSENNSSFLIVEVIGVGIIRISDRGDRMVTRDRVTREVKTYDMVELFTYGHLKDNLTSQLQTDDCVRLINYFTLPKDQSDVIIKSETPTENLLCVLEERGVIKSSNVDRLIGAFNELNIISSCHYLLDFYKRTRVQATSYDRFLATLSGHLTASLPEDLCGYFNISDEKKSSITSSQDPGLSLLLALNEIEVINSSEVGVLEQPFAELKLVQAVAKIHEYQSVVEEEKSQSMTEVDVKRELFIRCLQKKIKSWYETMTPVPWKKSCRWKSTDLFVGSGLVLTGSKAKTNVTNIDEQCKLKYTEAFTHDRLKSETRLILEGDPGSGKTMLASQLAYDWSQGKIDEIDILIFLPLKLVGIKTLVESMWEFYVPEKKNLSVSDIEDVIKDKDSKCCFILDGLEEYSGGGDTSEVMKVMTKNKYPSCKVIITARSDFAQDLPSCPMLKLGRFGKTERDAYIEKVFSGNPEKVLEVKNVIEDNPFILDLCSVPVLFVLAVHNIESMGSITSGHLHRVTPFMENMVETLCPSKTKTADLHSHYGSRGETSLGEVAYTGLCRGIQQLSWQKKFIEMSVPNSKQWLESGILVVDDSYAAVLGSKNQDKTFSTRPHVNTDTTDPKDSASVQNTTAIDSLHTVKKKPGPFQQTFQFIRQSRLTRPNTETATLATSPSDAHKKSSSDHMDSDEAETGKALPIQPEAEATRGEAEKAGSAAKHVPLQVKFLHKIIQEWFAARYFSHTISNFKSLYDEQRYLRESLPLINPADLHYVLRFSSALYPPCCHSIIKHLLMNYSEKEGGIPEYIMNCVFLCFAEFDGGPRSDILEAVRMVCKENITIHSEDSRLLQQAKVSMMKLASAARIIIKKLFLADLVISATKDFLTFNSGVTMKVIGTLHVLEISQWDQTLKDKDYPNIVKFIAKCRLLKEAKFRFPAPPPEVDKETLIDLALYNKAVTWMIGPRVSQTLDTKTGDWQLGTGKQLSARLPDHDSNQSTHPWHRQTITLETKAAISRDGGMLEIPNTGIKLYVPPNAFQDEIDQCQLQMRIILPGSRDEPVTSFASNTSSVVELLPNNLRLKQTVVLTLPHCLELEVDRGDGSYTAKIFISHHEMGAPVWKEKPNLLYYLDDAKCIIWLESFCWVKYEINGAIVEGKKIQIFAAGEPLAPGDNIVETEVGYFPDLPGGGEILRNNKSLMLSQQKPFIFLKKSELPLTLTLHTIKPTSWKPFEQSQEISFQSIADSEEKSCPFIFENENQVPSSTPILIFWISQGGRGIKLKLRPRTEENLVQNITSEESQHDTSLKQQYSSPCETPDAAVRPKILGQRKQNEKGNDPASHALTLYQPCDTQQNDIETHRQMAAYSSYQTFTPRGLHALGPVNPLVQQNYYGQHFSISPYGPHVRGGYSPYEMPDEETEGREGFHLSYGLIKKISRKLDPPDPLGNNWKQLADELGFTMEDIAIFETAPSSTFAVLECAEKRGKIKSLDQIKSILGKIGRSDAASVINSEGSKR